MKKSQIRILAILATVALLLGMALVALRYEKPQVQLPLLAQCQPEEITGLSFTNLSGTFAFQKAGDGWVLSNDANFPVSAATLDQMLQVLCSVRPQALVEGADPEELGLLAPQCTIYYTHPEGGSTLTVGSMNAVTDQLYVQANDTVYLTDTTLLQAFSGSLLDMAQAYTIPRPDNHESLTVMNSLGSFTLSCVGSQTGGSDGTWRVRVDDTWVDADPDKAYNFYFLTWDMHWQSVAGYITDSSQLSAYGLDAPQVRYTLTYGGEVFHLVLGADLPDGTTYAMCAGSDLVYTIDSLLVQWLSQATAQSVLPQT